jgi:hypothetical protein
MWIHSCRRPLAWVPLLALTVVALVLAQAVQPWPEGPVLLTLRGFGPHGIVFSDVVLLVLLVAISLTWLRLVAGWARVNAFLPSSGPARPDVAKPEPGARESG